MIGQQFCDHATERPNVDLVGIEDGSKEEFGGTVVARTDVGYIFLSRIEHFG